MQNLFISILIIFSFLFKEDKIYTKSGVPSSYGINSYVKTNQQKIISEFNHRIDSIFRDIDINTDDLSNEEEQNSYELGVFYYPDEIVVTTEEKFIAFEFKDLSKFKRRNTSYRESTVKGTILHELTHAYFNQMVYILHDKGMTISPDYAMLRTFSTRKSKFAANFIEEGICEYVVHYFNEANPISDYTAPENEAELLDEANHINIMYYYSVIYVKDFLDTYGIKRGIEMIIQEAPPSTIELLNPNMYFYRIKN